MAGGMRPPRPKPEVRARAPRGASGARDTSVGRRGNRWGRVRGCFCASLLSVRGGSGGRAGRRRRGRHTFLLISQFVRSRGRTNARGSEDRRILSYMREPPSPALSLSLSLSVCVRLSLSECASAFGACAGPPLAALLGYDPTYTQNCPIRDDSSEMAKNFTSMTLSRVAAAADLARALSLSLCTLRFDGASLSLGRGRPLRVRMRASPVLTPPAASRAHIPRLRRRCPCGCP